MNTRLVLVEDDPIIRLSEQRQLERAGYSVTCFDSGEAAVAWLDGNAHGIGLILMDIDLGPGIDGTEAARQILAQHEIPVLFLSSHTEPEIVARTEQISSYGYVVKNSGITVLDASIKMALKLAAERTAREEKELELEQILDATTDGIWKWDFTSSTLTFSDSYYRMLGCEPGAFPATYESWSERIHPDDRPAALAVATEYLKTKPDTYRNRFRLRRQDGTYLPVISTAKVVRRDRAGNALLMIGNHVDITKNRLIELELERQQDLYYRLFNDHSAPKVILDPENGRIVNVNNAAVKFYGYTRDDMLRMNIDRINCLSYEEISLAMQQARRREQDYFEFRHRLANGEIRDVQIFSNNFMQDGKQYLHAIVFDITESRKLQDKYRWLAEYDGSEALPSAGSYTPEYADVTTLNTCRLILDNTDRRKIQQTAEEVMALLDTSLAVYEANGDYAFGSFNSAWCRMLDQASFRRCGTTDTAAALRCGEWLCHEDCWHNSAKAAIASGKPTDISCVGGIRLYAVPVFADGKVIGAVNIGYGNPPEEDAELEQLAEKFGLEREQLRQAARQYNARPPYIIALAKRRCERMAEMIGEEVELALRTAALEQSRQEYTGLLDRLNCGYLRADNRGIITAANPVILRMSGYPALTGTPITQLYADPEQRTRLFRKLKTQESVESFEIMLRTASGATLPTACNISIVRDRHGERAGTEALIFDISARKALELQLREQRNLLESIFDSTMDLITVADADGTIIFTGRSHRKLGYPEGYFLGRNLISFVAEEDRELLKTELHSAVKNRQTERVIHRVRCADGTLLRLETINSFIPGQGETPDKLLLTSRDITARHNAMQEVLRTRNLLESILKVLPGSLNVIDTEFNLLLSNKEKFIRFNLEQQENTGRKCHAVFQQQETPCPWCKMDQVLRTGESYTEITGPEDPRTMVTGVIWKITNTPLLDEQGKIIGAIEYGVDITAVKQAEERALQQLGAQNMLIREAHHRIKNHLAAVAELVQLQAESEPEPAAASALRTVLNRIRSMTLLYTRLLRTEDDSRIATEAYCNELLDALFSLYPDYQITRRQQIENFELEPQQMTSVGMIINEFITNSVKHAFRSNRRGTITLQLSRNGKRGLLHLADDGPGFDRAQAKGSAGLGLALMQILAGQLQGELVCRSSNGAECRVDFPLPAGE